MDSDDEESLMIALGQRDMPYTPDLPPPPAPMPNSVLNSSEVEKILKKSYTDALHQFYKTMFLRDMVANVADGKFPVHTNNSLINDVHERTHDRFTTKPPYILITVNLKTDVTLQSLMKAVSKFVKKKTVLSYAYVYEVRSVDQGLHCHLLVHYSPKPYEFKRSTKSTFSKLCDVNNPHCLNFKFVELDKISSKYSYLLGNKSDKKSKSVSATKLYREKHSLLPIYESNPPLPCRVAEEITLITSDNSDVNHPPGPIHAEPGMGAEELAHN